MKKLFFLSVVGLLLFSGCTAARNIRNSKKLRVGMTKNEVLAIMGEPEKQESFNKPDLWYYYQRTNWLDGFVTPDECFPLLFKDGKLIGWGNHFYSDYNAERRRLIKELELPPETEGKGAGK